LTNPEGIAMSMDNPTINDIKELMQTEIACLLGANNTLIGTELGNLQKQINLITGTDTQAITDLQTQIANLTSMLDGDADTPGMQNLQNLLALIDRVLALESWKGTVDTQLSDLTLAVSTYETRIAALEQSGGTGATCDCEQIATDLAALNAQIVTLQGVDATQAAQITTLSGRVDGLVAQVTSLGEQLAAMAGDIATAGGNAAAALAAANAAQTAVDTLRDREDARHTDHGNKIEMIRGQLYNAFTGLCDAVTPGLAGSLAAAKAAALAA
jgi:outer membrane murein-binding lipoprotein Lpp